jgi:hypothetical protein
MSMGSGAMEDGAAAPEMSPEEREFMERMRQAQAMEQAYLRETFKWLIEHVARYFPDDQLAMEDQGSDVNFLQVVVENGEPSGVLVYRLPKFPNKKEMYQALAEDYREQLKVPEVLFVDTETDRVPDAPIEEGDAVYYEVAADKLTTRLAALRDELKRRARLRKLRESL